MHQLYQGVIKHLKLWVIEAFGAAEIDARCRRLPPNHHVHLFMKGISSLSRLTGQEHNNIAQFLLSIIIDFPIPDENQGFRHNRHFNTEHTERLHIDMAKDAYRASNRKDEYMQMTKWLERKEKMPKRPNPITGLNMTDDSIHVQPSQRDPRGRPVPGRFDTALIRIGNEEGDILKAYCVGRIRLVFTIAKLALAKIVPGVPRARWPKHLAYVKWFSPFSHQVDPNHLLQKVSRVEFSDGGGLASVIDVSDIV
ncbi:hypothetical protein K435DRAFT_806077 [Dendrothele bispora CBS 962.96]|uniref:Uncharacterized protein n=1 Tax=Dendrothele bispora (strain CBS 962.96) TaxID=1314807 RepID=A0A4S8L933_DENBC|nr:hypothetical protein K435DRAFT_806077 [Dendrothele bispora CBS 962.96]